MKWGEAQGGWSALPVIPGRDVHNGSRPHWHARLPFRAADKIL